MVRNRELHRGVDRRGHRDRAGAGGEHPDQCDRVAHRRADEDLGEPEDERPAGDHPRRGSAGERDAQRGDERAEPRRGHEEPEPTGIRVEHIPRKRRDEDVEVHRERRDEADDDGREEDDLGPPDVGQALGQVVPNLADGRGPRHPRPGVELRLVHD